MSINILTTEHEVETTQDVCVTKNDVVDVVRSDVNFCNTVNPNTVEAIKKEYSICYLYWIHLPEHIDVRNQGYVGITSNPGKRWSRHKKCEDTSYHLQNSIKKYGDALVYEVICVGTREYCSFMEYALRPTSEIGWNIRSGGDNRFVTPKQSEETKIKRGLYRRGEDHPSFGRKASSATRDKISKIHKGKVITLEHKEAISSKLKGKQLTKKHRENISNNRKGIKFTEEHKNNLSKARHKISVINLDTQEVFESIAKASETINNNQHIGRVCRGKAKTAGGFRWAYHKEVTDE